MSDCPRCLWPACLIVRAAVCAGGVPAAVGPGRSAISHVILLRVLQILNSCCWNCNVFGLSPKVTEGNYVRNVYGAVSVSRLEARPGSAAAHRHRGLACRHSNFACNSPAACSNIEFASLELQRFLCLLKFGPIELHAKFVWRWPCQPMLALPTGSLHRGLALRFLRTLRRPPHRWGMVSCCVGSLDVCLMFGTKFSLLGFLVVTTVQNSPCMHKKRQIEPFRASGESFIPDMR